MSQTTFGVGLRSLLPAPFVLFHADGKVFAMKDDSKGKQPESIDMGRGIKFCLNCNEMDDLATDSEAGNADTVKKRFQNCQKTGRFDGDICSRMYVVNENDFLDEQFIDPDDD